jgi:hypothetical protein
VLDGVVSGFSGTDVKSVEIEYVPPRDYQRAVKSQYLVYGCTRNSLAMSTTDGFHYEPADDVPLSTAVVKAVAAAHEEDVIEQKWVISDDINSDALDGLFQEQNLKMILQFEADTTTVTIVADKAGNPLITVEFHR